MSENKTKKKEALGEEISLTYDDVISSEHNTPDGWEFVRERNGESYRWGTNVEYILRQTSTQKLFEFSFRVATSGMDDWEGNDPVEYFCEVEEYTTIDYRAK